MIAAKRLPWPSICILLAVMILSCHRGTRNQVVNHENPIVETEFYVLELRPHAQIPGPGGAPSDFDAPEFDRRVLLCKPDVPSSTYANGLLEVANGVLTQEWHTTRRTTKQNKAAQTRVGQVEITVHIFPVDPGIEGRTVHFRTSDPLDASPYAGTIIPFFLIELLTRFFSSVDNRDPAIGAGVLRVSPHDMIDKGKRFPARNIGSDVVEIITIDDQDTAAAEVTLDFTDRYAGDNYFVEAALETAGGLPDWDNAAIVQLVAWKRMGLEVDTTYISSAILAENALSSDTTITVGSTEFIGTTTESVVLFDRNGNESAPNQIVAVDSSSNTIELIDPVGALFIAGQSGIAIPSVGAFPKSTGGIHEGYGLFSNGQDGGCFVEFVELPNVAPFLPRVKIVKPLSSEPLINNWRNSLNTKGSLYIAIVNRTEPFPNDERLGYSNFNFNRAYVAQNDPTLDDLANYTFRSRSFLREHTLVHELGHNMIGDTALGGIFSVDANHSFNNRWSHRGDPILPDILDFFFLISPTFFFDEAAYCVMYYRNDPRELFLIGFLEFLRVKNNGYHHIDFGRRHIYNVRDQVNDPSGWPGGELASLIIPSGSNTVNEGESIAFQISGPTTGKQWLTVDLGDATDTADFELWSNAPSAVLGGTLISPTLLTPAMAVQTGYLRAYEVDVQISIYLVASADLVGEGTETAIIKLLPNNGIFRDFSNDRLEIDITDLDEPGVNLETLASGSEDGTPGVLRVYRRGDLGPELLVNLDILPTSTATEGVDYAALSRTITIAAGQEEVTLNITPIDDAEIEGRESVDVVVVTGVDYSLGFNSAATVFILDNEPKVTISRLQDADETPPGTPGIFELRRTGDTAASLPVSLVWTGIAIQGIDYTVVPASVSFPVGSDVVQVQVTPLMDAIPEPEDIIRLDGENVAVEVVSGPGYFAEFPGNTAAILILDDEPVVSLSVLVRLADEGTLAPGEIIVSRTGDLSGSLEIDLQFTGTAVINVDYTHDAPVPVVSIPAGSTSLTIRVTPVQDGLIEGDEFVTVTLLSSANYRLGNSMGVVVTILDDD